MTLKLISGTIAPDGSKFTPPLEFWDVSAEGNTVFVDSVGLAVTVMNL